MDTEYKRILHIMDILLISWNVSSSSKLLETFLVSIYNWCRYCALEILIFINIIKSLQILPNILITTTTDIYNICCFVDQ